MKKTHILYCMLSFLLLACTDSNEPKVYTSFSGSWKCEEVSSINGYTKPYIVYVERNTSDTAQYIIRNFFDAGDNQMIVVKISGKNIELLQQPTSGQILRSFSGSVIPYNQIKLLYTIYDGERDVFYEAIYTRK
jgi:hypothetical protein